MGRAGDGSYACGRVRVRTWHTWHFKSANLQHLQVKKRVGQILSRLASISGCVVASAPYTLVQLAANAPASLMLVRCLVR